MEVPDTQFKRTTNECPVCEDGELLQAEYERFCDSCYTVMDEYTFPRTDVDDVWELFWDHRDGDGLYGEQRVEFVGGT